MKPLLSEDGYDLFLIEIEPDVEYAMNFKVYEVVSWNIDDNNTPYGKELYVQGTIKWDGCSHLWFGEEEGKEKTDGYLHLCGKLYWDRHCNVMIKLYELAKTTVIKYDNKVGG